MPTTPKTKIEKFLDLVQSMTSDEKLTASGLLRREIRLTTVEAKPIVKRRKRGPNRTEVRAQLDSEALAPSLATPPPNTATPLGEAPRRGRRPKVESLPLPPQAEPAGE